jgi:hypothetical protein
VTPLTPQSLLQQTTEPAKEVMGGAQAARHRGVLVVDEVAYRGSSEVTTKSYLRCKLRST